MEPPLSTENPEVRDGTAAPMSLTARLFNMLAAPGEVFDAIKGKEALVANWLVPALLLMLVGWVGSFLIFSNPAIKYQLDEISAQAVEKQIEKSKMPPEQAEQVRAATQKYGNIGTRVAAYAAPPFAALTTPFLWGLILWLAGKWGLKVDIGYMKAVEVVGLAAMIAVLEAVLRTLLILITQNIFAGPSLALLVIKDFDPQNPMHSVLALVNIITFWILGVRALGLARLAGGSFIKAAVWVFGVWAVYNGLTIGAGVLVRRIVGQ